MKDFWERVVARLNYQEMSFNDLSKVMGINRSTIATWKAKNLIPRADEAWQMAKELGTTLDYLLTGENDPLVNPEINTILLSVRDLDESTLRIVEVIIKALQKNLKKPPKSEVENQD